MPTAEDIERRGIVRRRLLHRVYDQLGGRTGVTVEANAVTTLLIYEDTSLVADELRDAFGYLRGEGLVRFPYLSDLVEITHEGVKEVEDSVAHPDEPTTHFPALNIVNNMSFHSSVGAVQMGPGAVAHVNQNTGLQAPDFLAVLRTLRTTVERSPEPVRSEALEYLEVIEEETSRPKPRRAPLLTNLQSLATLARAAPGILQEVEKLVAFIQAFFGS